MGVEGWQERKGRSCLGSLRHKQNYKYKSIEQLLKLKNKKGKGETREIYGARI